MIGEPDRVSALNSLAKCTGLVMMRATEEGSVGGKAADNGTAVGRGCELWHRGKTLEDLLRQLREEQRVEFPKADMAEVEKIVTRYVNDPRNEPEVVVTRSLEQEVKVVLQPHPSDPTGEPWIATGHTDQVRYRFPYEKERENLGFELWDGKNGKASGEDMLGDYAFQLAAYAVGLDATGQYQGLSVGGVIRTKGYITRSKMQPGEHNVFFHAGWDLDDCNAILANVMLQIATIRRGEAAHTPGAHCRYCPLNWPNCLTAGTLEHYMDRAKRRLPTCQT